MHACFAVAYSRARPHLPCSLFILAAPLLSCGRFPVSDTSAYTDMYMSCRMAEVATDDWQPGQRWVLACGQPRAALALSWCPGVSMCARARHACTWRQPLTADHAFSDAYGPRSCQSAVVTFCSQPRRSSPGGGARAGSIPSRRTRSIEGDARLPCIDSMCV